MPPPDLLRKTPVNSFNFEPPAHFRQFQDKSILQNSGNLGKGFLDIIHKKVWVAEKK
jgi:hypothetical protein